ncbi:Hypothetical_protein [Hexamita inflata]|uniref:Hypothetical_protein n=1 Tax=Hexamita inflata TaxID=28002 RepID=A0AA86U676_9EUKA|nr:Hypothetical protein HINF_LOCUS26957 [Hexamita inflata]
MVFYNVCVEAHVMSQDSSQLRVWKWGFRMLSEDYLCIPRASCALNIATSNYLTTIPPQELVLEQELLLPRRSDSLISLNNHEEMIILSECLGRLNIPLILKGWHEVA